MLSLLLSALLTSALPPPQHLRVICVTAPKTALSLQVASTEQQRERGLMNVTHLAAHSGMIFVFDRDAQIEFWMKDTLVPLDMIFVSADGTVRRVFSNVPVVPITTPDQDIPRRGAMAKYVIELGAGEALRDGIEPGVKLLNVTKLP